METSTTSNSSKPRTPSRLPVAIPRSRYSITGSSPSTQSKPSNKPLPSLPASSFNPPKLLRRSIKPEETPHISRQSKITFLNRSQTSKSKTKKKPKERVRTFQIGYVSSDGSKYGPKLTISKDADKILLGSTNLSPPALKPTLKGVVTERRLKSTDLKPLPKLPRRQSLLNTARNVTRTSLNVVPHNSGELDFASDIAMKLLHHAMMPGEQKKKEQIVSVASGLVEAIVTAREAEIDTIRAREELSAAGVKVLTAKADQAKSQKKALEIGKKALLESAL